MGKPNDQVSTKKIKWEKPVIIPLDRLHQTTQACQLASCLRQKNGIQRKELKPIAIKKVMLGLFLDVYDYEKLIEFIAPKVDKNKIIEFAEKHDINIQDLL